MTHSTVSGQPTCAHQVPSSSSSSSRLTVQRPAEGVAGAVITSQSFDPELFIPERFLQGSAGVAVGSQLVFGAGARRCLGEKLALADAKVFLAVLVRGLGVELAHGAEKAGFPFPQAHMSCRLFVQ
jgi:hypothetical protein